jgi:uncharacterized protein involved in type VI secretion and phage assembly
MSDFAALAGLLASGSQMGRIYGVVTGVVTNNQDPDGLGRVKVRFDWLSDQDESRWARMAAPMAGSAYGAYFLPEVDDEVVVAFDHGQMDYPYILGVLWNGKAKPPESNSDGKNNKRTLKSRSGHIIRLDDSDGAEKIEIIDKSGENTIVISTADNTITIKAKADITIQSSGGKLSLSGKGIEITSQAEVKIEASSSMDLKASGQMTVKGATVNIN